LAAVSKPNRKRMLFQRCSNRLRFSSKANFSDLPSHFIGKPKIKEFGRDAKQAFVSAAER
jgi:hypothetical protein